MFKIVTAAVLSLAIAAPPAAFAQSSPRGPAASQGHSRANTRLPQPSSGGVPTGKPAAGPITDSERQADRKAKRATTICKGC